VPRNQKRQRVISAKQRQLRKATAAARKLRSIFVERFAAIRSHVEWQVERSNNWPASEAGPPLNESILGALEKAERRFTDFAERLCATNSDMGWVTRHAQKAWPQFDKICESFANSRTLRDFHSNALEKAAKAIDSRSPKLRTGILDPTKRLLADLMTRFPKKSYRELLGTADGRGCDVPKRFTGHAHHVPGMVGAYDCPKCAHRMETYLSRIRKPLINLPQPPSSRRRRLPQTSSRRSRPGV
jgi:hypothetical protein